MKDWKYIVYVVGAILLFTLVKMLAPKQFDWTMTLAHEDKNPYGTYVLHELMPTLTPDTKIDLSYKTAYELKDSIQSNDVLFTLATTFRTGKDESIALLKHVENGGTVFISAQYFRGHFPDTLGIGTYDYIFKAGGVSLRDSAYMRIANIGLDTTHYNYLRDNTHQYFDRFDTTRTTVIAENDYAQPTTIRVSYGKGNFILNSTPAVFTNIYMMANENRQFAASTFSYFPEGNIYWTEYYQRGRMESQTPLRFILRNEPLMWAYYLTLGAILIFMLFEAKRKQRIIPIIKPLPNTSLQFVSTVGNLYYQNADHKNVAEKKINYLLEQIRTKYLVRTTHFDKDFIHTLASKSGNTEDLVATLFKKISFIQSSTVISAEQLMELNEHIEQFNQQSPHRKRTTQTRS